jgi:hypothetical protein
MPKGSARDHPGCKDAVRRPVGLLVLALLFGWIGLAHGEVPAESKACVDCHAKTSAGLVREWEHSRHSTVGIGCSVCHIQEYEQFTASHHARAGEIIASLDNVLAEKACGMPGNVADAVNGCWQCHGSILKFARDEKGEMRRIGSEGEPALAAETWPNSGIGRLNPDGSKGTCNACHSRHDFNPKLARNPENCGKCHMGPDHPQIEIYNESKHGIAFAANRERMALDGEGDWILGRDYSAAPTCATCHIGGYLTADGVVVGNSHDVGERISWTLRPIVSTKINLVVFEDGTKDDYPEGRPLPKVGDLVTSQEKYVDQEALQTREVQHAMARIRTWQDRRAEMQRVCANCHATTHVENFYRQFDDLVTLYNEKFAKPSNALMNDLQTDGVLNPRSPFGTTLQWTFYELWHHEGRRARHGASMMGPDYTHWHGMYEVAKCFYTKFLPEVTEEALGHSPEMGKKYDERVRTMLEGDAHLWLKGLTPKEIEEMKRSYQERYQEKR